ncbi:ribosome maturation protein SDO1 [Acrasis kona]|uniref:Ribosome maturation protein SDO1 n=1 Tax=Acrasis kona TaxID=1008807 RepID=A0AAW2Z2T8_9EUKA
MQRLTKTPTNQKIHTNISIVRLKHKGKRFEIACYKNKVCTQILTQKAKKTLMKYCKRVKFTPMSHMERLTKKTDLLKAFGDMELEEIMVLILDKGELQISPKERELMYESMFSEIVNYIVTMCINPDTQKPYPASVIERALKETHFAVQVTKSTKKQALDVIRKLKKTIPIERAQMRLKCTVFDSAHVRQLRTLLKNGDAKIEKDDYNVEDKCSTLVILIDPGLFRDIDELIVGSADAEVEVLNTTVQQEGEESIDDIDVSTSAIKIASSEDEQQDKQEEKQKTKKPLKQKKVKKTGEEGEEIKKKKKKDESEDEEELLQRVKKSRKNKKKGKAEEEEEEEEEDTRKHRRRKVVEEEEEESDDEPELNKRERRKAANKKKVVEVEEDDENEDEVDYGDEDEDDIN